jgi:hydroxymethylpyrimidine kinase/phosphomethylpyrimidine kinase
MDGAHREPGPSVLIIAGFDPSGGAGIIADIKTIHWFGCTPVAAITSLTFQNSAAFFGAIHETAESLRAQLLPVIEECQIAAVKVGMLPTVELVGEVSRLVCEMNLPAPVVDPVMRSTSGHKLIEEDAIGALLSDLMPLARIVTPNIPEAEKLTGQTIKSEIEMREAAAHIRAMGARAVLVKGGHLKPGSGVRGQESHHEAVDLLDDEGQVTVFRGEWIDAQNVRGTGCMLASAIAACLAKGISLDVSIGSAKKYVSELVAGSENSDQPSHQR